MKIAMLTNNYKPFIGGVPISIERLANGLREKGHIVYIFAPEYKSNIQEPYVIRYPVIPKKLDGGAVIPSIFNRIIEKEIKKLEIDVIHVHHPFLVGNVAIYLKKKYQIPVIFTYHTRYQQYLHYLKPYQIIQSDCENRTGGIIKEIEKKVLKFLADTLVSGYLSYYANQCDLVIVPTSFIKIHLLDEHVTKKISILPTGIEIREQSVNLLERTQETDKLEEMKSYYHEEESYLFCSVERLEKEKNIEFQLRGLALLKEKHQMKFRFLIIGEGSEKENLLLLREKLGLVKEVIFLGNIPNSEIHYYYQMSDLFLFSSLTETQGIVLLESMLEGTPVIAVEGSGVRDIIKNGYNGYLVDYNENEWVRKIATIMNDRELRKQLEVGAKKTANLYTTYEIANRAEEYYEKVLYEINLKNLATKFSPHQKEIMV